MLLKVTLKAGFYMGQGSANMSIADVYSVIGNQLMPEFIMKNCYQNQRHYFFYTRY
jgi:hypothetical protein